MKLIDRYIYAVTEHFPADSRDDVDKELRANIEDMLPDNATEDDVRIILEKLGSPIKLADEYCQTKRYLIGPSLYDSYVSVLKLVLGIVAAVLVSISLLDMVFTPSGNTGLFEISTSGFVNIFVDVFVNIIVSAIQGITQAFLWVTLTFIILERTRINEGNLPFANKKWSIDDLPSLPIPDKKKISRGETIFSMSCTVFFTALFCLKPELIGWYTKGSDGLILHEPLIVVERLQYYIPIIMLLAIVQLCIFVYKFIVMRWNLPLAIANAIHNIASSVLVYVMVGDTTLFNHRLAANITEHAGASASKVILTLAPRFVIIFIGICIWDSIAGFMKCKK
ncbi:hypothetical protein [Proteiniborus sp. MB09-C3]|uniref:HAAS signaling domain-containing protein n=1 Tax=Proteiniborus sp. MB09-C3 TaxID=3050072 RepID=UPI002552F077|nr:hypothetical protein [Proteiniborus sp. MB09-C3]WIV12457.1 hypothetical protein QO263_01645 [Proteiniborus sp. MB09-C3]